MENTTQGRKLDHLNICSRGGVEAREKTTWLEQVELVHSGLPDVNREDLDLSTKLFGKKLRHWKQFIRRNVHLISRFK